MTAHDVAPALVADGVAVRRGRREVLRDVDLTVAPGQILALLGPNGAGKSTLLGALGGTLTPSAGTVTRTGRVATVLQTPSLARRSAEANVVLATAWAGVPHAERRPRARDAMALMRVDHLADRPARTLSGGEQRRVHLARAVAISPDVMLLDEPFDGLDPQTHETLREDLAGALRRSEAAVVVVLHDRRDAWAIADRIAVLLDGRVRAIAEPQHVLDAPPTADVARFLGYNGELAGDGTVLLTRSTHVLIDPDGALSGTVARTYPTEDGVRLQISTARGEVWALHRSFDHRTGDTVRFDVRGGAEFPVPAPSAADRP